MVQREALLIIMTKGFIKTTKIFGFLVESTPKTQLREFGCGVTSRHARRHCRNRGLLRKQKGCGK